MIETTYAKPYKAQKHHVFIEGKGSLCGRYDFDPYDRHFETRRFSAFSALCPKCRKKLDDLVENGEAKVLENQMEDTIH